MTESPMPLPAMAQTSTSVPPAVLLANHLKALKLPTFAREHEKVAFEAAQDRADYPRYLLRLYELERIDRECPCHLRVAGADKTAGQGLVAAVRAAPAQSSSQHRS